MWTNFLPISKFLFTLKKKKKKNRWRWNLFTWSLFSKFYLFLFLFINWPFLDAKYGEYIYVFFSCGVGKFEIWRKSTKNQNDEKETLQNLCVFLWKGCGTIWQKQPFGIFQNCLLFRSAIYQLNWMIFYLLALFFSSYVKRVISMSYTYIFVCFIGIFNTILSKIRASING